MRPIETPEERMARIRQLIDEVQHARDTMADTPDSEHIVRDCDFALARLRAFLEAIEPK